MEYFEGYDITLIEKEWKTDKERVFELIKLNHHLTLNQFYLLAYLQFGLLSREVNQILVDLQDGNQLTIKKSTSTHNFFVEIIWEQ